MKKKSLIRKSLTRFVVCAAVLLLLATPLFYWLTRLFYVEDLIETVEAVRRGRDIPPLDLERDIMQGVMLQYGLIVAVLGVALVFTLRYVAHRLWQPFDWTLEALEAFRLESGSCPELAETDVREFDRLNTSVTRMMKHSLRSYKLQKEFTENASHELQTPLAVFRSRLDLLLQQPDLTESQAAIIQDLYRMNSRLSRLSRNLLLLAKMENGQFEQAAPVDVAALLDEQMPYLENLADGLTLERDFGADPVCLRANRTLLESLVTNLVVNAVRHTAPAGRVVVSLRPSGLTVANTAAGGPLEADRLFDRFYRSSAEGQGTGLGLAIVKAVCDYHGWHVAYRHADAMHRFEVTFG